MIKTIKKHQKSIKIRIPSWDSPGVQDQHSGVTLPRRRPKNAKHDAQMGQISNTIIDKKAKNTKPCKKMRIPSCDYTGVLDHHSGVYFTPR